MTTQNPNAMYADLHERNIVIEPTEKTRLLYGLRHLLGAVERLQALDYWREAYWVQLFRAAGLRKGHAYTAAELRQIAQPGDETPRFMGQLAHLVERGAFRRGFTLSCEICGLTRWYSLAAAGATPLRCQGCRQPLAIPLEQPFAYQPNPLLCDALKNGVITEILVLLWAQEH